MTTETTTETRTEPLPLTEEDIALIADLYDLDANFDAIFGHYVMPDEAVVALLDHTMATALCGFQWVPTRVVTTELPLCPKCNETFLACGWQ